MGAPPPFLLPRLLLLRLLEAAERMNVNSHSLSTFQHNKNNTKNNEEEKFYAEMTGQKSKTTKYTKKEGAF